MAQPNEPNRGDQAFWHLNRRDALMEPLAIAITAQAVQKPKFR